jgi:hypothetical protein
MFWENPSFYPFVKVSKEDTAFADPVSLIKYRFQARKRKYLVTLEEYSFGVYAIKFCGLKDRKSKKAYSYIYNDGDSLKVISTCLQIMLDMWRNHPGISFAFYAVPRTEEDKREDKRTRYRIYENIMLNLFSPHYFKHYMDPNANVYVLLNRSVKRKKQVIEKIGGFLLAEYDVLFAPYEGGQSREDQDGLRYK